MKQFCCGDVVPGCSARFQASSMDELLQAVGSHARADHGMSDIPMSLIAQVKSHITDLPAL